MDPDQTGSTLLAVEASKTFQLTTMQTTFVLIGTLGINHMKVLTLCVLMGSSI